MKLFGSSGTRGVANREVTPEFIHRVASATGTVWGTERVAIARDTRLTGRMLENAATSGFMSVGVDVERLGVLPTPGLQLYAEQEGIPGFVITASHNPPEYNGAKLVGPDGVELRVPELEVVEEAVLAESEYAVPWDEIGTDCSIDGAQDRYVEHVCGAVDCERIAGAGLTVAIDPGHGAGALTSPKLFRELGCRVVTVNGQPDGHFPGRDPEPVRRNLADLGRLVRASGADVGIAHDGDADRAIFFDERGEYVEGDTMLAALASATLEAGDTTVSAVNVSQRLVDVANDVGASLELTPIGSSNIITRIQELREGGASVPIAGEGNGGIYYPEYRLSRDGAYVGARFLELIAERAASEVLAPFDGYHNVRLGIEYEREAERDAMVEAIEKTASASAADVTAIDGWRLDYGDGWVLARRSGTEPLVRVYAEARTRDRAEELAARMREPIETARADA